MDPVTDLKNRVQAKKKLLRTEQAQIELLMQRIEFLTELKQKEQYKMYTSCSFQEPELGGKKEVDCLESQRSITEVETGRTT